MTQLTVSPPKAVSLDADVHALITDWHNALERQVRAGERAQTTKKAYIDGMGRFIAWCQDSKELSDEDIRDWLGDLRDNSHKPATVNLYLSGVRAFFAWAVGAQRLAYNPTVGVKGAQRKGTSRKHKRLTLTDDEMQRILAQPNVAKTEGKRDLALLALMAYTAARTSDLHRADVGNLRTEANQHVLDVHGKGRAEADELIVIFHPQAVNSLLDWLAVRGDQPGALFTSLSNKSRGGRLSLSSIRELVKGYFKSAGVRGKGKTTHSLRHTAITNAIRHGAPVQKVQAMARHANISTTMIYYHETDRVENPAEQFIDYSNGK